MTVEEEIKNIYTDKVATFENIPVDKFDELFVDNIVTSENNTCIIIYTHTESLNDSGIMTKLSWVVVWPWWPEDAMVGLYSCWWVSGCTHTKCATATSTDSPPKGYGTPNLVVVTGRWLVTGISMSRSGSRALRYKSV